MITEAVDLLGQRALPLGLAKFLLLLRRKGREV
jgi:hypothetical protein